MGSSNGKLTASLSLFPIGRVVATPAVLDFAKERDINLMALLKRHASGDWGDLDQADKDENDLSVNNEFRIKSSYTFEDGKIWIITEADRSSTCILLPSDF